MSDVAGLLAAATVVLTAGPALPEGVFWELAGASAAELSRRGFVRRDGATWRAGHPGWEGTLRRHVGVTADQWGRIAKAWRAEGERSGRDVSGEVGLALAAAGATAEALPLLTRATRTASGVSRVERAALLARETERCAELHPDHPAAAEAYAARAVAWGLAGEPRRAELAARRGVASVSEDAEPNALSYVLRAHAKALHELGRSADAIARFVRAESAAEVADDPHTTALVCLELANALDAAGRPDDAAVATGRGLTWATRSGHPLAVAYARKQMAALALAQGEPSAGLSHWAFALRVAEREGDGLLEVDTLRVLAAAKVQLGEPGEAAQLLDRASARAITLGRPLVADNVRQIRALLLVEIGQGDAAVALFEQIVDAAWARGADQREAIARFNLAEALLGLGRLDDALPHLDRVAALLPPHHVGHAYVAGARLRHAASSGAETAAEAALDELEQLVDVCDATLGASLTAALPAIDALHWTAAAARARALIQR